MHPSLFGVERASHAQACRDKISNVAVDWVRSFEPWLGEGASTLVRTHWQNAKGTRRIQRVAPLHRQRTA
jgi:hypothetical protein